MLYKFEKVIDGLSRYIDREIYSGMNDFQEMVARIAVGRIVGNTESLKKLLTDNGFIRTFGIIDAEGMVDVDELAKDIKREMERKGKISISIPMFGTMTFVPNDIDTIVNYIRGGV
jgi:hypothetical protein